MKKILYLGKIDEHILAFQHKLKRKDEDFLLELFDYSKSLKKAFATILKIKPQLIILELQAPDLQIGKLIKLVSVNSKIGPIPFICVMDEDIGNKIGKLPILGDAIYFYKDSDHEALFMCLRSLLNSESFQNEKIPTATFSENLTITQAIWVNYFSQTYAKIETNLDLIEGSLLRINLPIHSNIMRAHDHKVSGKTISDLQSHFNYSYKLEYQYQTGALKADLRTKLQYDLRYVLEKCPITEFVFEAIEDLKKKPKTMLLVTDKVESITEEEDPVSTVMKNLELLSKTIFFNILIKQSEKSPYHFNTVSIYDRSYALLVIGTDQLDKMNATILMRPRIENAHSEIHKDRPSVIVVCCDEVNNMDKIKELIFSITQFRDYFPFFLLFNYKGLDIDPLRHSLQYHFVVATKADINESLIIKFLDLYRVKKMEKEITKAKKNFQSLTSIGLDVKNIDHKVFLDYKIFNSLGDEKSVLQYSVSVQLISISENEIIFRTTGKLKVGDIFGLEQPVKLQILIVPALKNSKSISDTSVYRGIIHFIEPAKKKLLKKFVTRFAQVSSNRDTLLSEKEIIEIKRGFF
jgi:hypothetical protein